MIAAVLKRVGIAQVWNNTLGLLDGIGPMNAPDGVAPAIDPVFLSGSIHLTWSDGKSSELNWVFDPQFGDMTNTYSYSFDSGSDHVDTNVEAITPSADMLEVPASYFDESHVYRTYDSGNPSHSTGISIDNTSSYCTGTQTFEEWTGVSGEVHFAVSVDWSLTNPYQFYQWARLCDQLLAAATLADDVAAPTKTYPFDLFATETGYIRYPLEFAPYAAGSSDRQITNALIVRYNRSGSPLQYDWFAWDNTVDSGGGVNDGKIWAPFMTEPPASSTWIESIGIQWTGVTVSENQYNYNINPMFMHGCPVMLYEGFNILDLAGTPSAPTDNVAHICSVKSAFTTAKVHDAACWTYDPSTNSWASATWAPGQSLTQSGWFIYDPVKNLASGDVPSGYVLDPTSGLYIVDTLNPFMPGNVDSLFGFVTGTF